VPIVLAPRKAEVLSAITALDFHKEPMENEGEVSCPFCGQSSTLVIDTTVPSQRFTTDCEVCCRPFLVAVECEAGEILSLDVLSE
jgi:transposase-like protein